LISDQDRKFSRLCKYCESERVRDEILKVINWGGTVELFAELIAHGSSLQQQESFYIPGSRTLGFRGEYGMSWSDVLLEARGACDRERRLDLARTLDSDPAAKEAMRVKSWQNRRESAAVDNTARADEVGKAKDAHLQTEDEPLRADPEGEDAKMQTKSSQGFWKRLFSRASATTPSSLRKEIKAFIVSGSGNRDHLKELIQRCKAHPEGLSMLTDAHRRIDQRWHALRRDLDEAIKAWQPPHPDDTNGAMSAFENHMRRVRSELDRDPASAAVLANISRAFDRSSKTVGEKIGRLSIDGPSYFSVCYADLKLRLDVTVFQSSPDKAYAYFSESGGYLEWLGNSVLSPGSKEAAKQRNIPIFAHLIFVFDPDSQRVFAHLCVAPNGRGNESPVNILSSDLLTKEERALTAQKAVVCGPKGSPKRLALGGKEFPFFAQKQEDAFLQSCAASGQGAIEIPFTEFWPVMSRGYGRRIIGGDVRLLCARCFAKMPFMFEDKLPGGGLLDKAIILGGLPANLVESAKKARCPLCGSPNAILLWDHPPT
jgi:hypothetical protein